MRTPNFEASVPPAQQVPEPVFVSLLSGNTEFPQMYGGHIIRAGRTLLPFLSSGLSPADFSHSQLNDDQLERLKAETLRLHTAFGIPVKQVESNDPKYVMGRGFVTPENLQRVYLRARNGIVSTLTNYARFAIGAESIPAHLADPLEENYYYTNTLINNPEHWTKFRMLSLMWRKANEALDTPEGKRLGSELRRGLRETPVASVQKRREHTLGLVTLAQERLVGIVRSKLETIAEPLENTLGRTAAQDVVSLFILTSIHEHEML